MCAFELQRAVNKRLYVIEAFSRDPDLDLLHRMPEFEELKKELEEKIAKNNPNS